MSIVDDKPAPWSTAEATRRYLPDVVRLRRLIHADPEIGLHCHRTTEKVKAELSGLPLEFRDAKTTTGFIALLRGGRPTGRTVLLRGDMDALPVREDTGLDFASSNDGVMHACGHDAHTAMLAGAAKALCERQKDLPGDVLFMFQPGEEGLHGARYMIEDGLLDEPVPDAAFAMHILPTLPAGQIACRGGAFMASADELSATILGKGGHAAWPHESSDPIPVACEIVTALQAFVARQITIFDPIVLTIARITAGTTDNVIPDRAELLGTLRTLSPERRRQAQAGFERIVHHVAAAHGLTAQPRIKPGLPATINDPRAVELVRRSVLAVTGPEAWHAMDAPVMGSEDFSYVLQQVPGAMAFLGVAPGGTDPATNAPVHSPRMLIEESAMALGIAMHCEFATRFLADGLPDLVGA